jgi:hypothetical protein
MREHFEPIRSRNGNECDTRSIRHTHGERGRRGNGNYHGRADNGAFLHQLY